MSERLKNNEYMTLKDLPKKTFHLLSYPEQLAIIQRSVLETEGTKGFCEPLTADKVNKEEAQAVHLLLRPDLCGPFASTSLENHYAWRGYLDDNSKEVTKAFKRAIEDNLWDKYIGMCSYEPNWMGELVHAVAVTTAAYSPHSKGILPLSPGDFAPSYNTAVDKCSTNQNVLFIGAFSIKSVSDIWAIGKHLFPKNKLEIIDINGCLSVEAAKHYGIPFIKANGMNSCFSYHSHDTVVTNNLVHALDQNFWSYEPETLNDLRMSLFDEISRITKRCGKIVMVEQPLVRNISDINWPKEAENDSKVIKDQLKSTGFKDVSITPALSFKNRFLSDNFALTGIMRKEDFVVGKKDKSALLITATRS